MSKESSYYSISEFIRQSSWSFWDFISSSYNYYDFFSSFVFSISIIAFHYFVIHCIADLRVFPFSLPLFFLTNRKRSKEREREREREEGWMKDKESDHPPTPKYPPVPEKRRSNLRTATSSLERRRLRRGVATFKKEKSAIQIMIIDRDRDTHFIDRHFCHLLV